MAVVLPVLLVVVSLALAALGHGITVVRATDAARAAARSAARGDSDEVALGLARRELPDSASVRLARSGGDITVTVTVPGPRVVLGVRLPSVRATAVSVAEPGAPGVVAGSAAEGP
jgi:hypothetical protein